MVKHWWLLLGIIITGFAVRLSLIPFDQPVESDANTYLKYAIDFSFYGILPDAVTPLHNMGWTVLLSFLIKPFDAYNIDWLYFSAIQRITSIVFSTLTILVIYLISRKFFSPKLALVGAGLFAFDFRIIENSTFGITEPLFLLLSFTGFLFILFKGRVMSLLAIIFVGLSIIVRIEGVLMLIIIIVIYFHRNSITYKSTMHMMAMLAILIVPTYLIIDMNLHNGNPDGFISKAEKEYDILINSVYLNPQSLANSLIYMGWATFPNYILFIPVGLFVIIRNRKHLWLIGAMALLLVSGVWAYLDAFDTRYFFQSFVVVILISLAGIQYLNEKLYQHWCKV